MAQPDELVATLARAYSLTDLFPAEDSRVRKRLVEAASAVDDLLVLRVEEGRIRVGDDRIPDEDGSVRELARDLELAGVREVHLPADLAPENLVAFVRAVRDGAGSGDGERSARALSDELPQIGVAFTDEGPRRTGAARSVEEVFGDRESPAAEAAPEGPEAGSQERHGEPEEVREGLAPEPEGTDPGPDEPGDAAPEREEPVTLEEAGAGEEEEREPSPSDAAGAEVGSTGAAPETLGPLVDRFLEASPGERDAVASEIRTVAEEAGTGAVEERADAVERIADAAASGRVDPAAAEVARDLLTPAVAGRLAGRIGALREEESRDRLVDAAATLGAPMARALAEALADTDDRAARRTYIEAMVALGEDARPEVERMLDDSRWFVVRNGVRILGGIGAEGDIEHLTSPLAHEDPRVRRETVMSLARIGSEDAGMLLLGMVDDPDSDVRAAVATALGALGVERAVKVLLQRLENEEAENAQIQILRALGALGDPGAVQAIEKRAVGSFFSRPATPIRVAAYRALASIGTPHAMEVLEEARDDRDERVESAVRSLLSNDREG